MGARETLLASGCRVRSIPSTLEMDLSVAADAIEGTIGGVARRLRRVPDGLALDPALAGAWREEVFGAELTISGDGAARGPWMGGLRVASHRARVLRFRRA